MPRRRAVYSPYELSVIATSAIVGIVGGAAVSSELRGSTTGHGLGRASAFLIGLALLFCLAPAAHEVVIRKTSTGGSWTELPDPIRSAFRRRVMQHLLAMWVFAAASTLVIALHVADRVDFLVSAAIAGALSLTLLLVGVVIRRRLRVLWTQSKREEV